MGLSQDLIDAVFKTPPLLVMYPKPPPKVYIYKPFHECPPPQIFSKSPTPISPPVDLPVTNPDLQGHAQKAGGADPRTIAHAGSAEAKLAIARRHALLDFGEGVHVDQAAEQTLPKDDGEDEPHVGQKGEESVGGQQDEVEALEQGRRVQGVDAEQGQRGAREEDAGLVEGVVGRVEGAVVAEGGGGERKEERGRYTLVDGVFSHVDQEKGKHAGEGVRRKIWEEEGMKGKTLLLGEKKTAGAAEILDESGLPILRGVGDRAAARYGPKQTLMLVVCDWWIVFFEIILALLVS